MQRGAERIAGLFKARWVVMGHTHEPLISQVGPDSRYVNLGSWGTDDPPEEQLAVHASSCTFLELRARDGDYQAALLHWDLERGPVATSYESEPRSFPPEPEHGSLGATVEAHPRAREQRADTQVKMPATHATRQVVSSPPTIARGPS
jgi:hypothetical protein